MTKSPFLEQLRGEMRLRGYSIRTEKTYLFWIRQYIFYNAKRHPRLIISLLYGSGLRVTECLRLRIQDVDLRQLSVTVHDGKGRKDRKTLLSPSLVEPLKVHIQLATALQAQDNARGVGPSLPGVLSKKYPGAFRSPGWMYIFPSSCLSTDQMF